MPVLINSYAIGGTIYFFLLHGYIQTRNPTMWGNGWDMQEVLVTQSQ